ncbi:MAG: hypothetical protein RLZZ561_46 [Pseudomonadota bacterium]|jgi:hypothetical protein
MLGLKTTLSAVQLNQQDLRAALREKITATLQKYFPFYELGTCDGFAIARGAGGEGGKLNFRVAGHQRVLKGSGKLRSG